MDRSELQLSLYHRCREELGRYDAQLWQIPSISYALNGVLVGAISETGFCGLPAIVLSLGLIVLSAPLTMALVKNRLFQKARSVYAQDLFKKLILPDHRFRDVPAIPLTSDDAAAILRKADAGRDAATVLPRVERAVDRVVRRKGDDGYRSAYLYLLTALLATHLFQVGLLGYIGYRTACH